MSEVKSDSFNWKGEGGDKFAKVNPSSVEGTDAHFIDYFKVSVSDLFREVEQVLLEKGNLTAGLSLRGELCWRTKTRSWVRFRFHYAFFRETVILIPIG